MSGKSTQVQSTVLDLLKKDPKKAAVLLVLVAVLGVSWARMRGGSAPQSASAAAAKVSAAATGKKKPSSSPLPRVSDPSARASLEEWLGTPIPSISRNLFVIRYEYFPATDRLRPADSRTENMENFWDQLAKSMSARADQLEKRQHLIQNLRREASRLQFQSTVMGLNPKALVNGELVGEGDVVASFRVIKIEARKMVVEREGIRLEILMK
jgi:hypothetical protein